MMAADRSRLPALGPERRVHVSGDPADARSPTACASGRSSTARCRSSSVLALRAGRRRRRIRANQPGLAAITGDMLDEGCGDRSRARRARGARPDRRAARHRGRPRRDGPRPDHAGALSSTRGLELVRDMLIRPRFEQREFDRVRDLRLNRLLQLKDMPPALADRAFTQLLYRNHPYGHLPIGTEGALRALMIRDIAAFHRRAFMPSRTTVIAVGDASTRRWPPPCGARSRAGRCEASEPIADPDTFRHAGRRRPTRLALVHRAGAAQSELRIGHVALPRSTPDYHGAAGRQHDPRRPVRQPHQHEPARGQGLHLRRAHRVRVPPRARARSCCTPACSRRDRRRAARSARRDPRDPRRAAGHARGARARARLADPRLSAQLRDRRPGRARRRAARALRPARRLLHDLRAEGAGADRSRTSPRSPPSTSIPPGS